MANDRTLERRERVRQLWGKPDRIIAEILLEEGFTAGAERVPRTKAKRDEAEARKLNSMRRNVWNDREWWRVQWKKRATLPTSSDISVAREEHIASLESDLEDIFTMLEDEATKTTAKAMLIGERRMTRALLAKTRGVDELGAPDPDGEKPPAPVVGMLLGTASVTPELRKRLREQGVVIEDE
jgi:hypothetical protein